MRRLALALAVPALAAAACAAPSHQSTIHPTSHTPGQAAAGAAHLRNWPTYHRTPDRSGVTNLPVARPLQDAWNANLDGAVYGDPLVVNGQLIAATENDSVYGINPKNGHTKWRTHLGRPESQTDIRNDLPGCGDIFPLGITGTPAYDAKTGSVFVVAETLHGHHTLWALNATNGHRRWHTNMDVLPSRDRRAEQQRSALLVTGGRVFTSYGGLSGDCGNYVGYVTSTATSGNGTTRHYKVPTPREAGMWSPAGPVEGANGNVYVASGNGAEEFGKWDKSDSVTELAPKSLHRLGVFAPSVWKSDNRNDRDLGSSSPVPLPSIHRMVIAGKNNFVYLLKPSLGGVGSDIRSLNGCSAFGGAAHRGRIVLMPCHNGIRALKVGKHSLHWLWSAGGLYGSPVIAGNRVYLAHGSTDHLLGFVSILSLSTGQTITTMPTAPLTHFPSEVVDGRYIFVPTLRGVTAVRGS